MVRGATLAQAVVSEFWIVYSQENVSAQLTNESQSFKFGKELFGCVWGSKRMGVRKKKERKEVTIKEKRETTPEKKNYKNSFRSQQSHFLQLYIHCSCPHREQYSIVFLISCWGFKMCLWNKRHHLERMTSRQLKGPMGWRDVDLESDVLTRHVTALLASPGRAAMK